MFNRLALIGCGLMGGSLALAMQRACLVRHVVAYSPSEGTLQAALQGIPKGQIEAAIAYGLSRRRMFWRIILPQMIRLSLPGFTNNWLVLVKGTALVSLIGLQDVMFRAKGAAEATGKPFTFYLVAAGFYLFLTLASLIALGLVARRYEIGHRELTL